MDNSSDKSLYRLTEIDKARFWSKVKDTGYCWEWTANKDSCGYGMFKWFGKDRKASRIAYSLINGDIPKDIHVLHKCDNPGCVNPDHLFTGTHQDNMKDMARKGRGRTLGRSSKYLGVGWRNDSNNWRAYIAYSDNGKRKHISVGGFATEEEAAKARDQKVLELKLDLPLNFGSRPEKVEADQQEYSHNEFLKMVESIMDEYPVLREYKSRGIKYSDFDPNIKQLVKSHFKVKEVTKYIIPKQ